MLAYFMIMIVGLEHKGFDRRLIMQSYSSLIMH